MKKTAAMVLMCALCLLAAAAQALTMTGLETETVGRVWEESAFFPRMEALTGVAVEPHAVSDEKEYAQMLERMARGNVETDVLFKANLTRAQEIELLDGGALIDLAPLIEENMPNLTALLAEHPEWRESIALEDGRIASLPLLNEGERQVIVWINRAWLDELGLDMPASVGELTDALAAIKDGDPNRNGKRDEVGADLIGVFEMRWLLPYFGIVADDYNIARESDGTPVFAPELPAYREFIAMLRDWYDEGILTKDAFMDTHGAAALSTSSSEDETVISGLIVSVVPYTHVPVSASLDYEPLLMAGPDGQIRWRDMLGSVWTGCFAVTSACEDPASALRWADALYGEAGAVLAYAGVEGEDYAMDAEGRWNFLTDALRTVNDIRAEALMYTGTTMPGLAPTAFLARVDSEIDRYVIDQSEAVRAVSEQVTRPYSLSSQAQARADELAAVLGGMVDRGIARFVTGELELNDGNYETWIAGLREAGSEELTALFADR